MRELVNYLFVYGTLLDERNPFGIYLKEKCSFFKKGKLKGKLYDIGEYPGAIFQTDTEYFVHGCIFAMKETGRTLKTFDEYEGFGEDQPRPNEFIRDLIEIETDEGPEMCWVYLYNLPVEGLQVISSGKY